MKSAISGRTRLHTVLKPGITALESLQGRVSGLLRLPNGKVIQNIFWNHLLKEFPEVHQFQVVLADGGNLTVLLKGRMGLNPREKAICSAHCT